MTPILILAAGASRRMGGSDKLLKPLDGVPLLVRTVRQTVATGHPVFVAIPGPWHPRYATLRNEAVTCYDIPDAREGVGGTLRGAVKRLPPCKAFMVALADLPDLQTSDYNAVLTAFHTTPDVKIARGATQDGDAGHPIVFSAELRSEFPALAGDEGAKTIIQKTKTRTLLVPLEDNRARLDLDTPEDWTSYLSATNLLSH